MKTSKELLNGVSNKIISQRLKDISTVTLKDIARLLMDDFRDGTEVVFDCVLSELENRMQSDPFVKFCNSL